jgi:hypothetical protein
LEYPRKDAGASSIWLPRQPSFHWQVLITRRSTVLLMREALGGVGFGESKLATSRDSLRLGAKVAPAATFSMPMRVVGWCLGNRIRQLQENG